MTNEKKVLACIDQSRYADYVVDYAAWAARRMEAPLELLHVIDPRAVTASAADHSGAIGFDAQETLLTELSNEDEARSKSLRENGRMLLNRLRERAVQAGVVSHDMRQRAGVLSETLAEQEDSVDLFVLGRRGESAETTHRDIGRNVERVVRSLHQPILTVTEAFKEPRRVLIAFDGGIITRKGVEMVAGGTLFRGLPVHLVMSGTDSPDARKQLEWAKTILQTAGFEVVAVQIPGDAESVIATYIRDHEIDMLIMGAYGHSPLRSLFKGSKTADLLRSSTIPTLLLR